jgi:hypothetical protein
MVEPDVPPLDDEGARLAACVRDFSKRSQVVRARRLRVGIRPLALCEAEARKPRPICRMSGLSAALQSAGDAGI